MRPIAHPRTHFYSNNPINQLTAYSVLKLFAGLANAAFMVW
jgi:hypothetical protein